MKSEDRSRALEMILRRLCLVLEQVKCCVLVTQDGLAVASYPQDDGGNGTGRLTENLAEDAADLAIESRELAALAASLAGAGERAMKRLAQGEPGRLVLEGQGGIMLSLPVGDVSLAILAAADANLAQVLFAAQKAVEEIETVLAPV